MSTFRGVMSEFPDIRVDYFRSVGERPPLACFLSHIHSDHLTGLDAKSFKGPFVYCSPSTKGMLLQLEKYPDRINFEDGILESRMRTFKHLKDLIKAIPLETPTVIELAPGYEIRVTLFDSNHCPGSVMFLFETDHHAVLYTGDVRSEPWFVNNLTQNPYLISYIHSSHLKTLDCIYLDTSNIGPHIFPTKAEGLTELLQTMLKYPPDTVFHLSTWTYGYEGVWKAISHALDAKIHVGRYRMRVYRNALTELYQKEQMPSSLIANEGLALVGYKCGNTPQAGCLTEDPECRIHSCEKYMTCPKIDHNTVWITPIVARNTDGSELAEIGVGGGGSDLVQKREVEINSQNDIDVMLNFIAPTDRREARHLLFESLSSTGRTLSLDLMGLENDLSGKPRVKLSIDDLAKLISSSIEKQHRWDLTDEFQEKPTTHDLPKTIHFPYSWHSSLAECLDLLRVFRPRDVYPCTVDEINWHEGISVKALYGRECSSNVFAHDQEMRMKVSENSSLAAERPYAFGSSEAMVPRSSSSAVSCKIKARATEKLLNNFQGTSRSFDVDCSQVQVDAETLPKLLPPSDVVAISPGSQSQNLRRKSIAEQFGPGAKRLCLPFDGLDPTLDLKGTGQRDPVSRGEDSLDGEDVARPSAIVFAPILDVLEVSSPLISEQSYGLERGVDCFFDAEDEVYRCKFCYYEIWKPSQPFCTQCKDVEDEGLFFQEANPQPSITIEHVGDVEHDRHDLQRHVEDNYLDDASSAYDSQDDSDESFHEEYEIDSFIDDTSQDLSVDEDIISSDNETDYKEKFLTLNMSHINLSKKYRELELKYDALIKNNTS